MFPIASVCILLSKINLTVNRQTVQQNITISIKPQHPKNPKELSQNPPQKTKYFTTKL